MTRAVPPPPLPHMSARVIADAARTVSAPAVLFPPLKATMELVANIADVAMV